MFVLSRLNPSVWWYFARAGGLVAWGLLATSVVWGLIYAGRLTGKVPPPAWNFDLHRFLGGLSVTFVAIHVLALTADRYVDFGLSQVLVPFASHWRPGAVAWGIVALYLLVAVEATSLAMRWLPRRLWRQIHLLSFLLFAFSTVHAIQTGSDTENPLVRIFGSGLLAAASVTAALRLRGLRVKVREKVPPVVATAAAPAPVAGPAISTGVPPARQFISGPVLEPPPRGGALNFGCVHSRNREHPLPVEPPPATGTLPALVRRPAKVPRFAEPPPPFPDRVSPMAGGWPPAQ